MAKGNRQKAINSIRKRIEKYWTDENWLRKQGEEYLKAAKIVTAKDAASWAKAYTVMVR